MSSYDPEPKFLNAAAHEDKIIVPRKRCRVLDRTELTWRARGRLWVRLGIRVLLALVVVLAAVFLLPPLLSLFMPFVLALIVAWILNPLVRTVHQRLGISRRPAALLMVVLLFCLVGGAVAYFIYALAGEALSLANNWQQIWQELEQAGERVLTSLRPFLDSLPAPVWNGADELLPRVMEWLETAIPTMLAGLAGGAGSLAVGVPSFLVGLIVFLMATYFITADYPSLRYQVTRLFGGRTREHMLRLREIVSSAFGGYLRAEFFLSVGVFFILLIGFMIMRQSYALLIALLLAVMDFIPIIGAGTVMVPWAVVALITGEFREAVTLMAIWGVICLFRRVGEPKFVGAQTGLSPILSLVSIYVGMRLAGVAGMILGPILCLVVLGIGRAGFFNGWLEDLRLAVDDVCAFLKNRP